MSFVLLKSVFHYYYNHAGLLWARHVEKHEPDINSTEQHGADMTSGKQLKTTQS